MLLLSAINLVLTGCATTASRQTADDSPEGLRVYFNDPLAGLPEMEDLEAQANGLDKELIAFIDSSQETLDAAIYHLEATAVVEALDRACGRGVKIRLILEAQQPLPKGIPSCIQLKLDQNERLMHHKFLIADRKRVWTGSVNWTASSFYFDANNAVVIHSPSFAQAFLSEFEQMFTSALYGPDKRDNNEERFEINGLPIEVYFSPSDQPRKRLIELIENARESIILALFTLTDQKLYEVLLQAQSRGVRLKALWDFLNLADCQYSKADELLKEGVGLIEASPGLLHDKYAVIDDRIVITGSANWSKSGLERNDENILIIYDEQTAQQYKENFERLLSDALGYDSDAGQPPRVEVRHFDVARDAVLIQWRPHGLGVVERYEICRLSPKNECERVFERPGWAWYFVDRQVTPGHEYSYRVRGLANGQWTEYSNTYRAQVPEDIPLLTPEQAERDLRRYEGQIVTVRFTVTNRPALIEGHIFLNAGQDYKRDFTAFIPGCVLERFNGSGLDLFGLQGRTIEVTGKLEEYNGPEIVVRNPWQIVVLP